MHDYRAVQPRQIYASTAHRRDRRAARRRGRTGFAIVLVAATMLLATLTLIAALAPHVA